jgi:AAA domain
VSAVSPTTQLRLGLAAIGITPLPSTITKEVFLPGWTTRHIDEPEILSWDERRNWPNTSCRTTDHPCLDIDILDAEVASAVEQLVRAHFDGRGTMLLRTGRAPKRLIPFFTATPFAKRLLCYVAPNSAPHRIEFLGMGQQAVFYGMHESGNPYHWHADRDPIKVPPREWVNITEAEADQLLAEIDELLVEQFDYARAAAPNSDGSPRSSIHLTDVDEALANLHYAGEGGGGNIHDTELGCINALIVQGNCTESVVEEVAAAVGIYAAGNPLCARWDLEKERRRLEAMAYSFINKFPDYADRLPPDLYATRQIRRGQGVLDPQLAYDRTCKCWYYPVPPATPGTDNREKTTPRTGAEPTKKFRLVPFGQLRPGNDPGYLVDELIPLRGIILIWGKRKCLKSFWTYDLCFHIAHYPEYRGRTIQIGGAVVYCAFEGAHGYKKRAEALRRHHKVPDDTVVPLYLVPGRANMIKEHPSLILAVREQLMGELPRMVVLDTLNKSLVGSESKDVDMSAYIVAAEALRDAFDCVVAIIHHCGYDETHPRGHTSLTGAVIRGCSRRHARYRQKRDHARRARRLRDPQCRRNCRRRGRHQRQGAHVSCHRPDGRSRRRGRKAQRPGQRCNANPDRRLKVRPGRAWQHISAAGRKGCRPCRPRERGADAV